MKKTRFSLTLTLVGALLFSALFGVAASNAVAAYGHSVPAIVPAALVFLCMFVSKPAYIIGDGAIDMDDLVASLKDYANQAKTGVFSRFVNSAMYPWMTPIAGVRDQVPLIEVLLLDILQPGGKSTFNPTNGAVKFKDRFAKVRPGKADLQFTQVQIQQMKKSWLGILDDSQNGANPISVYDFPFEAYVFQKVTERFRKNLKQAMIKGVYNGTGTGKLDVMDGILTLIDADITATNIPAGNVFAGAPITATNGVAQIEGVGLLSLDDEDYADYPMICLASPRAITNYELDFRTRFSALPYKAGFDIKTIYGTNIEIVEVGEWSGSDRVVVTPKENLVMVYNDINMVDSMIIEREKRNLNLLMDVEAGVQYAIAEIIWTNDQN